METPERQRITFVLAEQAREGDADAFARLLERYRERLESLVHIRLGRRLRRRLEVEDILQETSLAAFRSMAGFTWKGEGSFFRWLSRIAENVIRSQVRRLDAAKRPREESRAFQEWPRAYGDGVERREQVDQDQISPLRHLLREERFRRLEAALDSLSPAHREVIILSRLQGLPVREIALRMKRTTTAVPMLLLRALRELKKAFGTTGSCGLPPIPLRLDPAGPVARAAGPTPEESPLEEHPRVREKRKRANRLDRARFFPAAWRGPTVELET